LFFTTHCVFFSFEGSSSKAGVYYDEVPPVPIPNTEVKLIRAENTWRAASRENRSMPVLRSSFLQKKVLRFFYSSLAQSVEHAAVNRGVVCSSQTGGAINPEAVYNGFGIFS
jgi:hypothetical protein